MLNWQGGFSAFVLYRKSNQRYEKFNIHTFSYPAENIAIGSKALMNNGQAADTMFKGMELTAISKKESIVTSGFSAQQVEIVSEAIGYDFTGVEKPQTDKDHYSLSYFSFVVPLVRAVQEQQAIIEKLQAEINVLKLKVK